MAELVSEAETSLKLCETFVTLGCGNLLLVKLYVFTINGSERNCDRVYDFRF